jgi:hypothetical protein
MLVCNVSMRPARHDIAADLAEVAAAVDGTTTGQVVFATLVDDPASVNEIVDAYLGVIMLEATSAGDVVDGDFVGAYTGNIAEVATATDTLNGGVLDTSVKLLLGFNGSNGSTGAPGMTDESQAAHGTATVTGNANISTAQFKFGVSSLLLDGSGDYITFPDSSDWDFGIGPFTIEGFFRFVASPSAAGCLVAQWPNGWAFWFSGGSLTFRSGLGNDIVGYSWSPTLNQWYHIAIDRDAGVARVYVDGAMVSKTTSYTPNLTGSTAVLAVGSLTPGGFGGFDINGYVDELRISNIARYASDAGFTVPTSAFPR